MTATDRAMAREEWDRIGALEDRVTIDDALLGTLRDRIRKLEAENDRLRVILDGCDDAAIERVALVLFARSFIPMRTVDQVRGMWEDAPDSTLEATRLAALELIRAAGELCGAIDDERRRHDELHGCWECGTSDMRGNVCAEHEALRVASREQRDTNGDPS